MTSKATVSVVFLMFSSTVLSLTSYTVTVANPTIDMLNSRSLPNLAASDVITFLLEFPDAATGAEPTQFNIELYDNTPLALSPQPAGGFGLSVSHNISFTSTNTLTWTVATPGSYYAQVRSPATAASLVPYYLTISNSNGGQIVKMSDYLRS